MRTMRRRKGKCWADRAAAGERAVPAATEQTELYDELVDHEEQVGEAEAEAGADMDTPPEASR